ncbi:caspase family protein, partial [Klebsiella pneumoniae]
MRSVLLFLLALVLSIPAGTASAAKRVALVIGVSEYRQVPRLPNPARDADVMAGLFRKAGFDTVDSRRDLGIAELRR